jgi:hypothetical protein
VAPKNREKSVNIQNGKHRAEPPKAEGVTTRAQARRTKRSEAPGPSQEGDEIVSSAWEHAAARKGGNGKSRARCEGKDDQLLNPALDLFNDAVYDPKMVVIPVILSMQEILNNSGTNQLIDVYDNYISAAERSLEDTFDAALYSDGLANGGKQLTGLATAVPIVTNTGTYGGIARSNVIWQTKTYDIHTLPAPLGPQATSTNIRAILNYVMTKQSRGKDYADLLIMSPEHYAAYDAATVAIQRQTNETSMGKLGFSALEYIGGGKRAEIVLDGGIGSNMPANTTFGINTDSFRVRYHPDRNFDKVFDGEGMMPIDKDAIAQFIGFMGEVTMTNPQFNWRMYDSNPAA